jgi:uncharacterized BrkB/YihY/UPF0761 family membrane protein
MRPTLKSTITLVVAAVVLFVLSASGQAGQYWESGPSWLGAIGWYGMLLCVLLLIVSGVYWVISRTRHRNRPSPQ